MKKIITGLVLATGLFAGSGIEYNGTYRCEEVGDPKTYYIIHKKDDIVRDTKSGAVFYKGTTGTNDYNQTYVVYERQNMSLQHFTGVNNKYYVNFMVFNNKGYLDTHIELDCKLFN